MPFALVIENKVKAREHDDQTQTYRDWAATRTAAEKCFLVYLRPSDADEPVCKDFIPITYQQLFDEVIRHCLGHPSLGLESKYLLEQYRQNLAATPKRGYQMAQPNRDVCLKIYKAHQKALDEIFLAVKGEAPVPAGKTGERRITTYNVTLDQLVSQGLLSLDDRLLANYRQRGYEAGLVRTPEGVRIEFEGTTYPLPTTPARKITASNLNGWRFWRVVGPDGEEKGLLDDIRARLMHGHDDEVEDDSAP
jgi:hypothetical protein